MSRSLTSISPDPRKILIVKPSALGDVVHSLPFLDSLKNRFPQAVIDWIVARSFHQVLEGHPMIRQLWIIDKDRWKKPAHFADTLRSVTGLARSLRAREYDLVVDLQGLLRSGLMALSTGCRTRVGFSEAREGSSFCYTHRVMGGHDIHAVDRYLEIADFLGCRPREPRFPLPPLQQAVSTSRIMGCLPERYAVIAPSTGGAAKPWLPERFGEVAARLPFPSVVITSASHKEIALRVVAASRGKAISLAGRTSIKELMAIIGGAAFLLSSDTGPMHIAAAMEIPVVALFGPTNPARTGPYGSRSTILSAGLSCSPCYRRKPCRDWRCMSAITVEQVLDAIGEEANRSPFRKETDG